jgi:hypothetical protein
LEEVGADLAMISVPKSAPPSEIETMAEVISADR